MVFLVWRKILISPINCEKWVGIFFFPITEDVGEAEGNYRFTSIPTDVKNAVTYVESRDFVDKEKIFLVGHSMGAWATILTASQDKRVKGAVAISGGISSTEAPSSARAKHLDNLITQGFLKGITLQEAIQDSIKRSKELAPQDWVAMISPRPLLFICGDRDATVNPDSVKSLYVKAGQPKKFVIIKGADHVFTGQRRVLVRIVTNWLKSHI